MVDAFFPPVALEEGQVEVPALDRGLPPLERLDGARAERQRREARRARQALLRAAVGRVDAPAADLHRHAAERGHAVGEEERAVVVRQSYRVLEGLPRAGRRLGMDERDQLRPPAALEGRLHLLGTYHPAPRRLDAYHHA